MSQQAALEAILAPCWHDAMTYGPRAAKGLIVLDARDIQALSVMDDAGIFTVFVAELIRPSLIFARDLSPLQNPFSIEIGNVAPSAAYIITQDLSIQPVIAPKE